MALVALLILTVAFVRASGDPWPAPSACALPLPKSYVCYHLEKGEKIVVDGKLDEPAWKDVGWTLPFMGQCSHRKQSKPGVVTYNQYSMNYMDVHISISIEQNARSSHTLYTHICICIVIFAHSAYEHRQRGGMYVLLLQ